MPKVPVKVTAPVPPVTAIAPVTTLARRRNRQGFPEGETIIVRRYHHPIVLLRALVFQFVLLVVGVAGLLVLANLNLEGAGNLGALGATLGTGGVIVLLILAVLWTLYAIADWRADWLVLTNRRLIVRDATPLQRETRREVPLNKVQNVTSQMPGPLNSSLNFGLLVIDTAGLGTVRFEDVSNPGGLRATILDAQKKVQATSQPYRSQYRQDMVRNILYGTPAPAAPPGAFTVPPSDREGYGVFNVLFPLRPQRYGMTVRWHKHWWFLLRAELWPLVALVVFELTVLVLGFAAGAATGSGAAGVPLLFIRPFVWLLILLFALYQWEDWRNDYYEVSGDTLIDKEALPLGLFQQTKETKLSRITDISNDVPGPFAMLLNYGNVVVKTPGEATAFTFDGVPNPGAVLGEIMDRIEAEREREQGQWARDMQDWIRSYNDEVQAYYAYWGTHPPPV